MNCVVELEDCMGLVEGETGYCSDTCVTGGVGGTAEVEETVAIRGGIPEAIIFPAIHTEHEVRPQGVHEVFPADAVRPFIAQK
jgi:hypothetical protein